MDDFSLFQWLVLGMLAAVTFCAGVITFGLDSSLDAMIRRLESALERVSKEIEKSTSEIKHSRDIILNQLSDVSD